MSNVRFDVGLTKMAKKNIRQTPKLQSLPPTSESFSDNVKKAHLQTCIWKNAKDSDPPDLDPTNFGWTIPTDKLPTPLIALQRICCGCASDQSCATARCGCCASQLACTIFCNCFLTSNCQNSFKKVLQSLVMRRYSVTVITKMLNKQLTSEQVIIFNNTIIAKNEVLQL